MADSDSSDDSDENDPKPETFGEFPLLSKMVRKRYFQYLEKELETNFRASTDAKLKPFLIRKCAKKIEKKVIKSCVITQLYQRKMIDIIHKVRQQTKAASLDRNIDQQMRIDNFQLNSLNTTPSKIACQDIGEANNTIGKSTENNIGSTLTKNNIQCDVTDNNKMIENSMVKCETELIASINKNSLMNNFYDDDIAKELDHLFAEDENTEFDDIFGLSSSNKTDDPQLVSILNEIRNAEVKRKLSQNNIKLLKEPLEPSRENDRQSHTPDIQTFAPSTDDNSNRLNNAQMISTLQATDLSRSLWPCELFMQKRCLTERLAGLVEQDIRWHDLIQTEFEALFGEDSDDEFGICSPSIELDDILMGSCTQRISPWIVKYLTQPFREGLIANRFLFKKLAKRLAFKIIRDNQYPNERFIKRTVENFFCQHPNVRSIEDINYI